MEAFFSKSGEAGSKDLKTFIGCGIAPQWFDHPWNHPQHGSRNKEITERLITQYGRHVIYGPLENGCIDLKALWFSQLATTKKVNPLNMGTDKIDTYSDCWTAHVGEDCDPTDIAYYASTRRNKKCVADNKSRNLILVVSRG